MSTYTSWPHFSKTKTVKSEVEVYFPNAIKTTIRNDKSWLLEALDN